jgi:exodeoxyribonuclease-3
MPLSVATWNINSVRIRLDLIRRFVEEAAPDVLCLQETKVDDPLFPREAFEEMGFGHMAIAGQKAYHGVATLSRIPLEAPERRDWCGKGDARHVSVTLPGGIALHNFYVPAGGDVPDREQNEKFGHKLDFVDEMTECFRDTGSSRTILVGDLNIAPLECDVWSHKQLLKVVSHTPIEVEKLTACQEAAPFIDVARRLTPPPEPIFTWWSYRAADWRAGNRGRRLDHIWVTPPLEPAILSNRVYERYRDGQGTSDHVPVMAEFDVEV